jgi:hypothetical protein
VVLKDILTITISSIAAAVGLFALIKGIIEYRKNSLTKRSELFLSMRSRLREDKEFIEISRLLETDDETLRDIPLIQKDRFTGFFEELAIMKNSGLINNQVTLYMFGYYAIRCNKSVNFWYGLNRKQKLWSLFFNFAEDMEKAEANFKFNRRDFHL